MKTKYLRLSIAFLLVSFFTFTISSTFAFWANDLIVLEDVTLVEVPIGEWGLTAGAPEGIPEYVLGATYSTGDYVWWEGKIYQIVGGGYASAPPPSTASYGPFNEITHLYQATNTYEVDDVVLYNNSFYRVINSGIANSSTPGTNGAGWFDMHSIEWSTGQTYVQGDYVLYNNKIPSAG